MIDFVKFKITDKALISKVWQNKNLVYEGKSEKRFNDEIKELQTKSYKNLYFTKFQNRLEVKGSIHYFYNNKEHNANDFYVQNCINTIKHIESLFKLDLNKCYLINLEYGVNIKPNTPVEELIINLMYHEKRPFNKPSNFQYKIAGIEAYKQIKAYNKSIQFPELCINTFRFEVKSKQAKYINSLGVFTLNDLIYSNTYNTFKQSLLKEWDKVLLFDTYNKCDTKYLNTHFWDQAIASKNRNKFNNCKKQYFKSLGSNNLHNQIFNLIQKKTILLITGAVSN